MTTEAAWAFAERIAKDIAAQDRQLISSRAMGMIAAEFDAATLRPTARETARDALVETCIEEDKAYACWDSVFNDDAMTADDLEPLTEACKAAQENRRAKVAAYLATVTE